MAVGVLSQFWELPVLPTVIYRALLKIQLLYLKSVLHQELIICLVFLFCFCFSCRSRGYTNISCFFYFMFHNFHPQNLFKQAACFQTVKATIGAFFYFLNFLQNKTQLYRHNRSPFLFFLYISAPFYVLVFLFFPRACEWDMSKRCSESRTSIFDFVYPNLVLSECSSASYFYKHCNSLQSSKC